jgi:hypothetical protein
VLDHVGLDARVIEKHVRAVAEWPTCAWRPAGGPRWSCPPWRRSPRPDS